MSQHFTPCIQREMVIKALRKAVEAGVATPLDQKVYALYYLSGGKNVLESERIQEAFIQIRQGGISLAEIIFREVSRNHLIRE